MSTIDVRDTQLFYKDTGAGLPLLFVHGMCGDADVWDDQVSRLSDRFRCITYDRRGHTRSQRGTEPESTPTHAEDAAGLIEGLGIRPLVVASSGGARIAVELLRSHGDLVVGAVLSEPPLFGLVPAADEQLKADIGAAVQPAMETGGPRAAVDAFFGVLCPGLWNAIDEPRRDRYRANAEMMLAELTGPPYRSSPQELGSIRVPALVISGTDSHPALRTIARTLADALPDSRFTELAGAGHVTYAERPADFADAVATFAQHMV